MNATNHPHPGAVISDEVLSPLGLSLTRAAVTLAVPRAYLAQVLKDQAGINQELADGLERAGFSTARFWMALQAEYDLHRPASGRPI